MRTRLLNAIVFAGLSVTLCCCGNKVSRSLDEIDGMLGDRPAEALARIDSIDPSTLSARLQARHTLLRAIALDKNSFEDGSFVSEMEKATEWYDRHGNRRDRLRSDYYYGDQLRGAGRLEEAAVRKYRPQIMYETDGRPAEGEEYTFKSNWYYFLGDNASLSLDSRGFGLVPESYIVGRVG